VSPPNNEDCRRLEQDEPVLLQRRHTAIRVERQARLLAVTASSHVDDNELVQDMLLSERDEDATKRSSGL
jgi:hypothetical protein